MTGRTLTSGVGTALADGAVRAVLFVEMDFSSGFLRVNNSAQTIAWNSQNWLGVGGLGSVEAITESITLENRGLRFAISGVDPANIALALGTQYQGRACKVWFAPLSTDYATIADPVLVFFGRMDTMDITIAETATIMVSAESRLADWDRPRVRRYNAADQLRTSASDLGFAFVPQMVEKTLRWGY